MGIYESSQNKAKHDFKLTAYKEKDKITHSAEDIKKIISEVVYSSLMM
jgi:hypothetical protein